MKIKWGRCRVGCGSPHRIWIAQDKDAPTKLGAQQTPLEDMIRCALCSLFGSVQHASLVSNVVKSMKETVCLSKRHQMRLASEKKKRLTGLDGLELLFLWVQLLDRVVILESFKVYPIPGFRAWGRSDELDASGATLAVFRGSLSTRPVKSVEGSRSVC
jgi:hypothetical protein